MATEFGGFFAGADAVPARLSRRARAIEFIGDSHTVGYGNMSATRQCSEDEVWRLTDTSRGIAALLAARYGADYQVNAISGRGVVRNYDGFAGDTLPQAYPFKLFNKSQLARNPAWRPQVIAVALGTNDFSTPLKAGEKWKSREELRSDFVASYVKFLRQLRSRNPRAQIVVWATDLSDGEIRTHAAKAVERLRSTGVKRVGFVPVSGLAMSGCNFHPSLEDDRKITNALATYLDAQPGAWTAR
jgi:lysophospholipase L1-like esterase